MSQLIETASQPGNWEELKFFYVGLELRGFKKMADRSRMTGDCHVRICGRLRGRFPRPTRLEHIHTGTKSLTYLISLQNQILLLITVGSRNGELL
jgi:hypothetical protein